ncbi:MAG: hypothetical protein KGN02_13080 [bacterium]|nr:hypothetical protein [bacterium]
MIAPVGPASPKSKAAPVNGAHSAQAAAFDIALDERAELERERAALEALTMAQLKDEDAIMKKWIEMI